MRIVAGGSMTGRCQTTLQPQSLYATGRIRLVNGAQCLFAANMKVGTRLYEIANATLHNNRLAASGVGYFKDSKGRPGSLMVNLVKTK